MRLLGFRFRECLGKQLYQLLEIVGRDVLVILDDNPLNSPGIVINDVIISIYKICSFTHFGFPPVC